MTRDEGVDEFLAACNDVIEDWERSPDAASWSGDGSHPYDTGGQSTYDDVWVRSTRSLPSAAEDAHLPSARSDFLYDEMGAVVDAQPRLAAFGRGLGMGRSRPGRTSSPWASLWDVVTDVEDEADGQLREQVNDGVLAVRVTARGDDRARTPSDR